MTNPPVPPPVTGPSSRPPMLAWPDLRDWLAADPGLLPDGTPAVPGR